MKRVFLFLLLCITISVTVFNSCQADEDVFYSCNPNVNSWVKSNLTRIHKMSRKDWLTYPDSLCIPIYRAFTPKQKQTVWLEKIAETIQQKNWNKKEIEHLHKLSEMINNKIVWFSDEGIEKHDALYEEYQLFAYRWSKYATEELNWDKETILSIAYTAKVYTEIKAKIQERTSEKIDHPDTGVTDNNDCDCKQSNVFWTTCTGTHYCENLSCNKTNHGCGFVTAESCDGLCILK